MKQLTNEGGCAPVESADGGTLYYLRPCDHDAALLARPASDGAERTVVRCVKQATFAVAPQGIFYLECGDSGPHVVRHWNEATRQDHYTNSQRTIEETTEGLLGAYEGYQQKTREWVERMG